MKKKQFIKNMSEKDTIECYFVITKADKKESKNKTPYWDIVLQDSTGSISAKIWSPLSATITEIQKENFVYVNGVVESYNGTLQLNLNKFSVLIGEELQSVQLTEFVPCSERPIEEMWNELISLCTNVFVYKPWHDFMMSFFSTPWIMDLLKISSAAKSMHHAYKGGLLEHMLSVAGLARVLVSQYPQADEQIVVAGALLHDIGKIVEMQGMLSTEYTTEGKLLGHITQGIEMITPFMQEAQLDVYLQIHLKHIILSHHGQYEYGSPKLPQTAEAFLVHYADNIDAKMEMFRKSFDALTDEEEGWGRIYGVGDIFHAKKTPDMEKNTKDTSDGILGQLSLL